MDIERLEELKRLCDAATPGPWQWCEAGEKCYYFVMGRFARVDSDDPLPPGHVDPAIAFVNELVAEAEHQNGNADFSFISAARTAVPELVAENAKLRKLLSRCRSDIFQTARTNYCNLTGIDLITPGDGALVDRIGKCAVHKHGVEGSLALVREIEAALRGEAPSAEAARKENSDG